MPEYWFVINPASEDLYAALKDVLDGRPGFHVIKDRRSRPSRSLTVERRKAHVWEGDYVRIAEQDDSTHR
jgi:hypothetical protein